jgi:hypothetical protein
MYTLCFVVIIIKVVLWVAIPKQLDFPITLLISFRNVKHLKYSNKMNELSIIIFLISMRLEGFCTPKMVFLRFLRVILENFKILYSPLDQLKNLNNLVY